MTSRAAALALPFVIAAVLSGCSAEADDAGSAGRTSESAVESSAAATTSPSTATSAEPADDSSAPASPTAAQDEWPAEAEAVHGGQYWAVYLAVARSGTEEEKLQAAYASAQSLDHRAGIGSLCETGAEEALGLEPGVSYDAVSIFFDSAGAAQQFVDLY